MNEKLFEALREKYPWCAERERDGLALKLSASPECGDGWNSLLGRLFVCLDSLAMTAKTPIEVNTIKEKFGSLRVYVDLGGSEDFARAVYGAIAEAEEASETICEVCGGPGQLRRLGGAGGWLTTLCQVDGADSPEAVKPQTSRFIAVDQPKKPDP